MSDKTFKVGIGSNTVITTRHKEVEYPHLLIEQNGGSIIIFLDEVKTLVAQLIEATIYLLGVEGNE